mmetsp:Transcript_27196/g.59095  ORF Transcript_27196/g.59095 Transcript_27196/m.59095 type:complete len:302 (-) Transcript_27196:3070-3975(-)
MLHEGPQNGVVELVIDATSVNCLCQHSLDRVPWDLVRTNVRCLSVLCDAVDPCVDDVSAADLISITELVLLGPTDGMESKALEHNSVQEGQQEVQATPLHRLAIRPVGGQHLSEGPLQGGFHTTWRLEDVDARQADQVRGNLRVELHGQEQAEVLVRVHAVELLLELGQPLDRQMHVLEQHPGACFRAGGDGLVRNSESLLGAHSSRCQTFSGRLRKLGDLATRIKSGDGDHHDGGSGLAVGLQDSGQIEGRHVHEALAQNDVHQLHARENHAIGSERLQEQNLLQNHVSLRVASLSPAIR